MLSSTDRLTNPEQHTSRALLSILVRPGSELFYKAKAWATEAGETTKSGSRESRIESNYGTAIGLRAKGASCRLIVWSNTGSASSI